MKKNNLYLKQKKFQWKVRKFRFLRVMLEPEDVKIEKEKVGEVLEQSEFKSIKNIQKFLSFSNYYRWFVRNNGLEESYM